LARCRWGPVKASGQLVRAGAERGKVLGRCGAGERGRRGGRVGRMRERWERALGWARGRAAGMRARCACSDVESGLAWGSCVATMWGPRERCQAGCIDAEEALTLLADKRGQGVRWKRRSRGRAGGRAADWWGAGRAVCAAAETGQWGQRSGALRCSAEFGTSKTAGGLGACWA
jgi:hypothetical protein